MASEPSATGQGPPHQPQPSNIALVPVEDQELDRSSSPVLNIQETLKRHTRRSVLNFQPQTLPGTRWDKLEIERQRERKRGQESGAEATGTPTTSGRSLHDRKIQVSSQSTSDDRGSDLIPGRRQSQQQQGQRSEIHSVASSEHILTQGPATTRGVFSIKRGQPTRSVPSSRSSVGNIQASMARRPGRNQVDLVAELKETINDSLSKLHEIREKLAPIGPQIIALEEELKAKEADGSVTVEDTKKLDELYRATIKLTEQETGILHNPPDDLINKMGILNAMVSRDDTQAPGRSSAASKQRGSKRSAIDTEVVIAVDSPGPSPSDVRSSDQLRRVKGQGQRSSSVASQTPRESTSRLDETSDAARTGVAERVKMLLLHAEVAYRQSKATHDSDGERIHCTINGITKDKGRTIYDIKDKDESENLLYTARAEDLLPIPPPNSQLPTFSPGKAVIALYPGTTTFYNAQVISLFTKRDAYSLKFEGEENEKEVKEVERRYVLDTKTK